MRKLLAVALLALLAAPLVGCDQETKVKDTKEVSTPEGRTRVTTEQKVEKSGDHKDPNADRSVRP